MGVKNKKKKVFIIILLILGIDYIVSIYSLPNTSWKFYTGQKWFVWISIKNNDRSSFTVSNGIIYYNEKPVAVPVLNFGRYILIFHWDDENTGVTFYINKG